MSGGAARHFNYNRDTVHSLDRLHSVMIEGFEGSQVRAALARTIEFAGSFAHVEGTKESD
jgi:hypothetical protein